MSNLAGVRWLSVEAMVWPTRAMYNETRCFARRERKVKEERGEKRERERDRERKKEEK